MVGVNVVNVPFDVPPQAVLESSLPHCETHRSETERRWEEHRRRGDHCPCPLNTDYFLSPHLLLKVLARAFEIQAHMTCGGSQADAPCGLEIVGQC